MTQISIVRLGADEVGTLQSALGEANLPTSDLHGAGRAFYRFADDAGAAGFGGIEGNGPDRLLRSVVIPAERRGQSIGRQIVTLLEAEARSTGTERLHVLTTTAASFFRSNGYTDAERSFAPDGVAASREFSSLCPASATYLVKAL